MNLDHFRNMLTVLETVQDHVHRAELIFSLSEANGNLFFQDAKLTLFMQGRGLRIYQGDKRVEDLEAWLSNQPKHINRLSLEPFKANLANMVAMTKAGFIRITISNDGSDDTTYSEAAHESLRSDAIKLNKYEKREVKALREDF